MFQETHEFLKIQTSRVISIEGLEELRQALVVQLFIEVAFLLPSSLLLVFQR